jgi:TonB family protein
MIKLSILIILALAISSCCHQVASIPNCSEAMKGVTLVDDDTLVPPPPQDSGFIDHQAEPEMVCETSPTYPFLAMAKGIESSLMLQVFVDKYGYVRRVSVLKCTQPGYGFEEAAIAAANASWYKPAEFNGKPIGVWIEYGMKFVLKRK